MMATDILSSLPELPAGSAFLWVHILDILTVINQ